MRWVGAVNAKNMCVIQVWVLTVCVYIYICACRSVITYGREVTQQHRETPIEPVGKSSQKQHGAPIHTKIWMDGHHNVHIYKIHTHTQSYILKFKLQFYLGRPTTNRSRPSSTYNSETKDTTRETGQESQTPNTHPTHTHSSSSHSTAYHNNESLL